MKTIKRKLVAVVLCILSLLIFCSVGLFVLQTNVVYAAENSENSDVNTMQFDIPDYEGEKVYATYEFIKLNDTECSVRISNKTEATTAKIPQKGTISGIEYTVTEIASNGATSSSKLVVVDLPRTIKKIGNMAFANCAKLKYIDLQSVTEIGSSAFYRCPELDLIVIPKTVQVVGSNIFRSNNTQVEVRASENDCVNWSSSWITGNSNQDVHYDSKITTNPLAEMVKDNLARSGNAIKGFIITDGQTNISDMDALDSSIFINEDIVIPKECQYTDGEYYPILAIDDFAFSFSKFRNIIIEYSQEPIIIGSNAFSYANDEFLSAENRNVIINRAVVYKEKGDMDSAKVSDSIFFNAKFESIILPDNSRIAQAMFADCAYLKNIYFATPSENPYERGKNEEEKLLNKLSDLVQSYPSKVEVPEGVKSIGANAFENAINIEEFHLTDKIETVYATILAGWDSTNQTVFVHNEYVLPEYDSVTGKGWHPQWASKFTNIIYDKEFFKVTFDPSNGQLPDGFEETIVVEYGKTFELPTPSGNRLHFEGWYWQDNIFSSNTLPVKSDITLKARWSPKYKVTLKSEDGETTYKVIDVIYGHKMDALSLNNFEGKLYGKRILGFYGGVNNSIPYYLSNDGYLIGENPWEVNGDGTIYAQEEIIEYKLKYVDNERGFENPNKTKFSISDENFDIKAIYDYSGCQKFVWNYSNTSQLDLSIPYVDDTICIEGTWTDIVTRINYNFNGGREFFGEYPTSIKYNESKKIGEPYKFECNFEGWSLNGVKLTDSTLSNQVEEEITLIANWSIRENVSKRTIIQAGTYTITSSGYYTLPYSYSGNISIIIESYVREVHISSSYYRLYTNVSITIKSSMVNPGPCDLYLENIGIKAPSGQAAIYMCRENSSGTSGGSGMIPENPNISAYIPPITVPTFPVIKSTGANYSLSTRSVDVDLNMESCLNLYTYGKVNIYGGSVSNKQYKNAGCAIFCERLKIKHADNLVIYGGDADELSGDAGCGVVVLYSVSLYDTNHTNYKGIIEVLGGEKTTTEMVGGSLVPKKTRTNPVCNLNAT